eukprot:TRINITY_DN6685_c0_g3_i2.p1 TRINITY_DN6685_c0_g3~~TRINITY_DN6685_c0_g3_i2.p1  ORF type:complete len:127 (-),score=22.94 TRINITY_DN6685_c0_g3_i2:94-474(-)
MVSGYGSTAIFEATLNGLLFFFCILCEVSLIFFSCKCIISLNDPEYTRLLEEESTKLISINSTNFIAKPTKPEPAVFSYQDPYSSQIIGGGGVNPTFLDYIIYTLLTKNFLLTYRDTLKVVTVKSK